MALLARWKFDETEGTSCADDTGNGNTGTAIGTTIVAGIDGNCRQFNNLTGDNVACGTSSSLSFAPNKPFTLAARIWLDSLFDDSEVGVGGIVGRHSLYQREYLLSYDGANEQIKFCLFTPDGMGDFNYLGVYTPYSKTLKGDTWHDIVATYDGSGLAAGLLIYIDGSLAPLTAYSYEYTGMTTFSNLSTKIGTTDTNSNFKGKIDDVRIYDSALSAEEVATLYQTSDPVTDVTLNQYFLEMYSGDTFQFLATVGGGTGQGVTWSCTGGTITQNGLFTAGAVGMGSVTATSVEDNTKSATATITVYPPVAVSIDPETANVYAGGTIQLVAEVTGGMGDTSVTWAAPDGGEVVDGLFTAPAVPGEYRVIATSNEYGPKSATATITVTKPAGDGIFPAIYPAILGDPRPQIL